MNSDKRIRITLLLWTLLVAMAVYNVYFGIGTGYWKRGDTSSDIFLKQFLVVAITSIGFVQFFGGQIHLNRFKFRAIILSLGFLIGYFISELLFASGETTDELLRVSSYVLAYMITSVVIRKVTSKDILLVFKLLNYLITLYLVYYVLVEHDSTIRLGSRYIDANYFGAVLILGMAYPCYLLKTDTKYRVYHILSSILIVFGVIQSGSSGAILNLVIFASVFFGRRLYYRLVFLAPIALVLFILLANTSFVLDIRSAELLDNQSETYDLSVNTRLRQYIRLGELISYGKMSYLFGFGGSNIKAMIGQDLHNSILRPYLAGGVLSLTCWLLLLGNFLRLKGKSDEFRLIKALFIGWLFHSVTLPQETLPLYWFLFTLMTISYEEHIVNRF